MSEMFKLTGRNTVKTTTPEANNKVTSEKTAATNKPQSTGSTSAGSNSVFGNSGKTTNNVSTQEKINAFSAEKLNEINKEHERMLKALEEEDPQVNQNDEAEEAEEEQAEFTEEDITVATEESIEELEQEIDAILNEDNEEVQQNETVQEQETTPETDNTAEIVEDEVEETNFKAEEGVLPNNSDKPSSGMHFSGSTNASVDSILSRIQQGLTSRTNRVTGSTGATTNSMSSSTYSSSSSTSGVMTTQDRQRLVEELADTVLGMNEREIYDKLTEEGYSFCQVNGGDDFLSNWCGDMAYYIVDNTVGCPDWYNRENCNVSACADVARVAAENDAILYDSASGPLTEEAVSNLQPGDLIITDTSSGSLHLRVVQEIRDDGTIVTLEGNTNPDNPVNGDYGDASQYCVNSHELSVEDYGRIHYCVAMGNETVNNEEEQVAERRGSTVPAASTSV